LDRATPLWTMTVNAGACAAARGTVTAPIKTRNARPALTSEAVIESQRESQMLPGGHRFRHIHAQTSPIDAETQIGEPAAQRRQPIGGQSAGPAADEPCLSRVREHDQIRALKREERLRASSSGADEPYDQCSERLTAVLGLREDYAIAGRHLGPRERGVDDVTVTRAVPEAVARERIGSPRRQPLLQRQRIAADPSAANSRRLTRPDGLTRV